MKIPKVNRSDMILTLTTIVVLAATLKFLLDGASITMGEHIIVFGHVDSMTYGTLLSPVLAAHGFLEHKKEKVKNNDNQS